MPAAAIPKPTGSSCRSSSTRKHELDLVTRCRETAGPVASSGPDVRPDANEVALTKHTILFLAANPLGTDRLALDEEARAIQEELERSGHRDRFELVTRWAVRPMDLLRELRKLKPTVVHFSGHGSSDKRGAARQNTSPRRDVVAVDGERQHCLFFQGPDGRPKLVSTAALQATFAAAGSSVKLVTLSACYSDPQAEALAGHIDCVVGIPGELGDNAARSFAIGFYGGLGERESVAAAYRQGCAAIGLEGLPDADKPRLTVRNGADAEQVVLANPAGGDSAGRSLAMVLPRTPAYPNAEIQVLSKRLRDAQVRRQQLRETGFPTDEVDREIVELRRKLREGGQLRAGDSLSDGRYLLIKPAGRGGFAVVWEAWDRAKQQRVAIKVLHQHLAGDPQRRERFFRGARVMMDLEHPAVVRVHDPLGKEEGFCYFVMELVPGRNLRDAVLEKHVQLGDVLPLILQVGEALALAQARGMIHRDIKPANILLDEHGNAKLTDFDLVGAHDSTGGTRTGAMGTVVYAAPECLQKPQDATTRADVFGLGMTAIFCLSGQELTLDTFRDAAATVAKLDCSASVRKVLERAVEWRPDRRFPDAAAMVDALRDAMNGSSQTATEGLSQRSDDGANLDLRERPDWAVASGRDHDGLWATFAVGGVLHRMRWIPPGRFLMGSPASEPGRLDDEGPQHWVTITKGYWLGETTVTQALWVTVMGENPSRFLSDDRPVEHVSWIDCQKFIDRLNRQLGGLETRLPTEAEWERACRAGTTAAMWVGDLTLRGAHDAPELDAIAWYGGNSGVGFELDNGHDSSGWLEKQHPHTPAGTHPVGRKTPNPYGLHDMLGNVFEWCQDTADDNHCRPYTSEPAEDPVSPGQGPYRAARGGWWRGNANVVRAATRLAFPRVARRDSLGFRLAAGQVSARR